MLNCDLLKLEEEFSYAKGGDEQRLQCELDICLTSTQYSALGLASQQSQPHLRGRQAPRSRQGG